MSSVPLDRITAAGDVARSERFASGPLDDVLRDVVLTDVERCLIAAASDMLTALIEIEAVDSMAVVDSERFDKALGAVRATIAKAEGR